MELSIVLLQHKSTCDQSLYQLISGVITYTNPSEIFPVVIVSRCKWPKGVSAY